MLEDLPIHDACMKGNLQLVEELLTKIPTVHLETQTKGLWETPLFIAAKYSLPDILEKLLAVCFLLKSQTGFKFSC